MKLDYVISNLISNIVILNDSFMNFTNTYLYRFELTLAKMEIVQNN
jgi:hypothetical protein